MSGLGIHDLWLFVVTVAVLNATPGVDLLLTIGRTLQHGVRGGVATALGIGAGCGLHTLAAAFGLAALMAASAQAFTVVKWVGALYLAWVAFGLLRSAADAGPPQGGRASPRGIGAGTPATRGALFRQGLLTNALNPKVALFFLALLPQFIDSDAPHKTLAFLVLGAWFIVQGTLFLLALVLLVARLRQLAPSPSLRRSLEAGGGLLFLGLAARLATASRP